MIHKPGFYCSPLGVDGALLLASDLSSNSFRRISSVLGARSLRGVPRGISTSRIFSSLCRPPVPDGGRSGREGGGYSGKGSFRRKKNHAANPRIARRTIAPPTAPPIMAPVLLDLCMVMIVALVADGEGKGEDEEDCEEDMGVDCAGSWE